MFLFLSTDLGIYFMLCLTLETTVVVFREARSATADGRKCDEPGFSKYYRQEQTVKLQDWAARLVNERFLRSLRTM